MIHRMGKSRKRWPLMIGGTVIALPGLLALAIFALSAVCPPCTWIGLPPPGETAQASVSGSGTIFHGVRPIGTQAFEQALRRVVRP